MAKQFTMTGKIWPFLCTLLISCAYSEKPPLRLATQSPSNAYEVLLEEQADISGDPFFTKHGHHEVRLTARKEGHTIIEKELLYSGGTYDERFQDLFPGHEWISDSALRFGQSGTGPQKGDELVVHNETNGTLPYLLVRAGKYEMFLLLDLAPKSTARLATASQSDGRNDSTYVSCKGVLQGGNHIPEIGRNFEIRGKDRVPGHYAVTVVDGNVLITSQEFPTR